MYIWRIINIVHRVIYFYPQPRCCSRATMASADTSHSSSRVRANNETETNVDSNKADEDEETAKFESVITPEQVLSATIARRRRNITKKRSQSGGRPPRDQTPVRELSPSDDLKDENENRHDDDDNDNENDNTNRTKNELSKSEEILSKNETKQAKEIHNEKQRSESQLTQQMPETKLKTETKYTKIVKQSSSNDVIVKPSRSLQRPETRETTQTVVVEHKIELKPDSIKQSKSSDAIRPSRSHQRFVQKSKETSNSEQATNGIQKSKSDVTIRPFRSQPRPEINSSKQRTEETKEKPALKEPKPEVKEQKPEIRQKPSEIKQEVEKTEKTGKLTRSRIREKKDAPSEMTQSELMSLMNVAKRHLSSHSDRRTKKPIVEKRAIIKRSQSTPRPQTCDDEDLIESFKRAQRLSLELGTAKMNVDYSDSESSVPSSYIEDDDKNEKENEASIEDLVKEKQKLKEKLKLIKRAKLESMASSKPSEPSEPRKRRAFITVIKDTRTSWKQFIVDNAEEYERIRLMKNTCISHLVVMMIFCGCGGLIFRFTEGAFENFYKCGVKRVKRDFIDALWDGSHHMRVEDWKSLARRKLREFEEQLHTAHEAGIHTYSGQRGWSFLNAVVYCITVVTTIGYGHISPSTTTGRAITIVYAIFGIPLFLILLADFGKLFTRGIKFLWAFVRRLYYTGSCRRIRKNETAQEVMKGVQMVYEIATFRRPSQSHMEEGNLPPLAQPPSLGTSLGTSPGQAPSENSIHSRHTHLTADRMSNIGNETPNTPAPSNFAVDDEFNLPISVAILVLLLYILSGALMYWTWENWSFFEAFYFVFISMSTIGFGDFVPEHPMFMMASIVYLVFGLALTSMCINVVQVKLSDTFRQASAKISTTIGLKIAAEEDGSVIQVPMPNSVELADVHLSQKTEESEKEKIKEKKKDKKKDKGDDTK